MSENLSNPRPTRLTIDPEHPDPALIARAAERIRAGGLVAFPTETVYGLGANALDREAVKRIFAAKGRPAFNPLIVHCADRAMAAALAASWPAAAERLAQAFWPGPLTLVLSRRGSVPDEVTAGLPTVALRVPAHRVALALLSAAGTPIAAPSANPSTGISPTRAAHVQKGLAAVELILDAGETPLGIESTVIDLSGPAPVLLRPGTLERARLEEVLGEEFRAPRELEGSAPRPGPGMLRRHYAPHARVLLLPLGERGAGVARVRDEFGAEIRTGALLLGDTHGADLIEHPIALPRDPAGYAAGLYAALHELDERGCDLILVEAIPEEASWAGIRDRLERAATPA